jgi:hypothetical protein
MKTFESIRWQGKAALCIIEAINLPLLPRLLLLSLTFKQKDKTKQKITSTCTVVVNWRSKQLLA